MESIKIELESCFENLKKYIIEMNRYWKELYFERTSGKITLLMYLKKITEKEILFDIANKMSSCGQLDRFDDAFDMIKNKNK